MTDSLPMPRVGEPIRADHIQAITKALRKRTPISTPDMRVRETSTGFYLEPVRRGGGGSGAPLDLGLNCTVLGDGVSVEITAATICGTMPTIGGTRLDADPAPTVTIDASGTEYIIATITGTYQVTDSIFVHPAFSSITSVVISKSGTMPNEQEVRDDGVHTLLIATYVNGTKTAQNGYGPIVYILQDQLDGTASAMLVATRASS